jgi:hypothetical protein
VDAETRRRFAQGGTQGRTYTPRPRRTKAAAKWVRWIMQCARRMRDDCRELAALRPLRTTAAGPDAASAVSALATSELFGRP